MEYKVKEKPIAKAHIIKVGYRIGSKGILRKEPIVNCLIISADLLLQMKGGRAAVCSTKTAINVGLEFSTTSTLWLPL